MWCAQGATLVSNPAVPTKGSSATITATVPVGTFTATDVIAVSTTAGTCAAVAAAPAVVGTPTITGSTVTVSITFADAADYIICYTETGQPASQITVTVTGPTGVTPNAAGLTSLAGSLVLTFAGVGMDPAAGRDDAKIVVGMNADCTTATAVDLCCATAALKIAGTATSVTYTPSPLPYGGLFTICYRSYEAGRGTVHQSIGQLAMSGPTGFAPTIVPVGSFTLTVDGHDLTTGAAGDRIMIASAGVCDDTNVVAASDNLTPMGGNPTFDATVLTPGNNYAVCYRVASLHAGATATTYYTMSNTLTVSGATSFAPTTAPGAGTVPVTFTGVNLDSTSVGDSAKLVKGTDCLMGTAVFVGGIPGAPQFTPASVSGVTSLTIDVVITEGGTFTMCYKSTLAGEYQPLSPIFEVAGAASFVPTVVPQFFVGSLSVTGALLNAGDAISVVPDGSACGSAAATALVWTVSSTTQGTAAITSTTTLATSGNYRVCFTPFGGAEFMMTEPLVVSGAQSISPTTLIAGVSEIITVTGTNIGTSDQMKLVDQATEDCTPAFATHGTVVATSSAGQFTVTVPYGGVFTLCYNLGGGPTFTASATVTVKGVRKLSPFAPVVAAVGSAVTFELEGSLLGALDLLSVVQNTAAGCSGTHVLPVPALTVVSPSLVSSGGIVFSSGGQFLMCYTVSGGPALPLNPLLSVKGPIGFTPTAVNFGVSTALTFTGLALSTRDSFRLVDSGQNCADASVPLIPIATAGSVVISPAKGGLFFICYRPFEGGFVLMPNSVSVSGPSTVTPNSFYANVATTVTMTGLGLANTDNVKLVDPSTGCTGAAVFASQQAVTATFTAIFTATAVGTYHFCYKLQSATDYAYFDTFTVKGVSSFSPTVIEVSYAASITLSGVGLDPLQDRVLISTSGTCPTPAPDTSTPSFVTGTNTTLVYTTSLLQGGTNRAVCLWTDNRWIALTPLLTILGPTTRTPVSTATPFEAGAKHQFQVIGQGLNGGFDRVRWVKAPIIAGGSTTCNIPAIADAQVLAGSPVLTPVVQLPGGKYIMCYALGPTGTFIPIGTPLGGVAGGEVGELELLGPSGFWVTSTKTTAGQLLDLGFDNLVATTSYTVRLCRNGDSAQPVPLSTGDDTTFMGSVSVYPLLGGDAQVCFSVSGTDFVALPMIVQGAAYDPTTPIGSAGVITIDGPTSVTLPASSTSFTLSAGTQYDMTLAGTNLSTDSSVVRWAPSDDGCIEAVWLTNSIATAELVTSTTLRTTFHLAGHFVLCYTYPDDTPQVRSLALPVVTTTGMYRTASVEVPLAVSGSTLSIPSNTTTPSADIWYWAQTTATESVGVEACPTDATVIAAAQKSTLLGVTGAQATYNTTDINPGYLRVCAKQGTSTVYYTLPYLVVVSGPVSFSPQSVPSPGTYRVTFTGVNITDADKVRLIPQTQGCDDAASAAFEQSLSGLTFTTQAFTTPAWYTVCYRLNGATSFRALATPFQVTGVAVGLAVTGVVPATVESMEAFVIYAQVVDASGAVVAQSGGTMVISAQNSPGVPVPLDAGLSKTVVDGKTNFSIALGTTGVHTLLLTYTRGSQTFTTTTSDIFVSEGNVSAVAATVSSASFSSGDSFTVTYQLVDQGYNPLKIQDGAASLVLTALDSSAIGGQVMGTTTGLTNINGLGTLSDLQIDKAGSYRLRVDIVSDMVTYKSKEIDIVVTAGSGVSLVISLQWANAMTVTAGTLLSIDASVEDWGNNTLYVSNPTTFFVRIASTPAPPAGGTLYSTDPSLCSAQGTCQAVSGGVITQQGIARFRNLWLDTPGTYALEVVAPLMTTVTNTVIIREGSANHLRVLEGSIQVTTDRTFALSVTVRDLGGNVLTSVADAAVTAVGSTGSTLKGTLSRLTSSGVAIFSDLSFGTPGTFSVRFTHQNLVLVGNSASIFVDVVFAAPIDSLLYPLLHLNTPLSGLDQNAARANAASIAGIPESNIQIIATEAKDGGTLVYFQIVGEEDGNAVATLLRDRLLTNSTAAASFQGGAMLSTPELVTKVGGGSTLVITPSPGSSSSSSSSGLAFGVIIAIVMGVLLCLILTALFVWFMWSSKKTERNNNGDELGKEPQEQDNNWNEDPKENPHRGSRYGGYPSQNDNPLDQAPYNHRSPVRTPADTGGAVESTPQVERTIQTPHDTAPDQPPVEDYHLPEPTASPTSPNYNVDPSPASPVGNQPASPYYSNAPNGTFNAI